MTIQISADMIVASAAVIVPALSAATVYLRVAMRAESLQTRITISSAVEKHYVRKESCKMERLLASVTGVEDDETANGFTD